MSNIIEDSKPALLWATLTIAGSLHSTLNIVGGIVSIGYTLFKIYVDYRKNKNNEK